LQIDEGEVVMSVKKDYLHKLDCELREWDDKISKLEAQIEKATPEDKVEYIDHIERLKTKQKLARKKHEELEQAHESVWEGLKDGIDSIFDDMISYTESIMSKFKD
jgi:chromatin segregation and condensation protein Rec8/ScpA/Scc1 (kleisin family)